MRKPFLVSTAFICLCLLSCDFNSIELDKIQGPTLTNTFAINLGSIKYTAGELIEDLEDESLQSEEGDDLFLSFVSVDTSIFDDIEEFIEINEVTNSDTYTPFDTDIPAQGSENVVTVPTRVFDFEFNAEGGEQIDSTYFNGGTLRYTISTEFDVQIDYTLTLIDIRSQASNDPVVFENVLLEGESSKSESRPLDGLKNVAERDGMSNIFNVSLDLVFTIPAGRPVDASNEVTLELEFLDNEFSAVFGDFGMDPVDVEEDTTQLDAFDEFNEGGLTLRNPFITLDLVNKFGIELGLDFSSIKSVDFDGSEVDLTGEVVDNLQFVDAPNDTQLGEGVSTSLSIDIDNSNIDELLNITPEKLLFNISSIPNPPGSDNLNNYLFDSSYLEIRTTIEIPLDFSMDGFSKDFDVSFSGSDLEDADSLIINARVVNDIPFDGTLDISFKDDTGEILYTLSSIAFFESPPIGSDGRTTQSQESQASIRLEDEGIEAFLESTEVVATLNIFTLGSDSGEFVKVFSDYDIEIYLTAQGRVEVEL